MGTTAQHGLSSTHEKEYEIIWVDGDSLDSYADIIVEALQDQPASYQKLYTIPEILALILNNQLTAWLGYENGKYVGMVLASFIPYGEGIRSCKIEFISCKNLKTILNMAAPMENYLGKVGVSFIEAVAHPTIAKYVEKFLGYETAAVYVKRSLKRELH